MRRMQLIFEHNYTSNLYAIHNNHYNSDTLHKFSYLILDYVRGYMHCMLVRDKIYIFKIKWHSFKQHRLINIEQFS